MAHQGGQPLGANRAFIDVGVAVTVRTQRRNGIIQVEALQSLKANGLINLCNQAVGAIDSREIESARPQVLSIDANPNTLVATGRVNDCANLFETTTNCAARSSSVLN